MKLKPSLPAWTIIFPAIAWVLYFTKSENSGTVFTVLLAVFLIGSVMAAVHHAEVVAHRVGEPFGTLLLAIAITVIEVSLIISLMLAGGPDTAALARDTVFAAIMIIITGIIGRVFGLSHFNTLYGIVFFSHQVGSFFGAWMGGLVFDWRGNYDYAWAMIIVFGLFAAAMHAPIDQRPQAARAAPQPA